MKKHLLLLIFLIFSLADIFCLIENNDQYNHNVDSDYIDIGLNEKNGVYGFNPYLRKSYAILYLGLGPGAYNLRTNKFENKSIKSESPDYNEFGALVNFYMDFPELMGFYFNGNIFISRKSYKIFGGGDLNWWNSFCPYFKDTYFGYKQKYLSIKVGFQNLISSDAIYNHLLLDDYSGSLCALRIDSMLGRFVDMQIVYAMIRPHQTPWYTGTTTLGADSSSDNAKFYDSFYGKSLYTHKINFRPLPWIRIGICEGVMFTGENINPYYANPFFIFIADQFLQGVVENKDGSRNNLGSADLLASIDFNIGFNGWRIYGEFFFDDFNGEYFKFQAETHPAKFGFILGGELRGYLFTHYYKFSPLAEFIISNLYFNIEYGAVSKYTYARDPNFLTEYVRHEYFYRFSDRQPAQSDIDQVNRIGNFLGFMYGPNSDCFDIAIGWRSDLNNVKEYNAEYQADVYFDSQKKKKIPERLFKIQLHFRQYRLGDERDVLMPNYWNENVGSGVDKLDRGTEFLSKVVEIGDILDLNIYSDVIKIDRFTLGLETKFYFFWDSIYPNSTYIDPWNHIDNDTQFNFVFRWDFGIVISW